MGIYIPGMEMPKICSVCRLFGEYGCPFIGAVGYALTRRERSEDCPLVPVPAHGRLVDADKLAVIAYTGTDGRPDTFDAGVNWLAEQIDALPTVIPEEDDRA